MRGYTVFHVLKAFEDKKCDRIFNYFAAGWNRDGLALREAEKFLRLAPGPADRHLLIQKGVVGERTETRVAEIDGEDRVREIARILGGVTVSDNMLLSARELIETGKQY